MALEAGERIGAYEIVSLLGAGGMGEVYRARDTKLGRDVALKILPDSFAADPERLARFKREAQVLASLDHPNIGAIYGFEDSDGVHALVLQLVEGATLADRIAQASIPLDEALPIARQIAEALEAAHEQGIIHRDLKPANIKLRPDGVVKVLDFGLAKLLDVDHAESRQSRANRPALTNSPTLTSPAMTMAGVILGTAAYMSPEQAKGRPADTRSDIWSFGCVLYEMLTSIRAFGGEDVSDTLAFVLTKAPDLSALPTATPSAIRKLVRRCLEKDRKRRLADASDARLEIDEAMASPGEDRLIPGMHVPAHIALWKRPSVVGATALVIGGLLVAFAMPNVRPVTPPSAVARFAVALPAGQRFTENGLQVIAISAAGDRMAFVANRRVYLRSLSDLEAKPIAGVEGSLGQITDPIFSPDGASMAFVAGSPASIKRVAVTGGTPVTICDGCGALGTMHWDDNGIVFAQGGRGLPAGFAGARSTEGSHRIMRVPAGGGEPKLLFNVTDGIPWNVQMLPGGDVVLFGLLQGTPNALRSGELAWDKAQIVLQSLRSGERRVLIEGAVGARYLPTGHIVYGREGVLFGRRFDVRHLQTIGEEVPVVEGVRRPTFLGGSPPPATSYFDVSATGTLMYVPGSPTTAALTDLALLDQHGGVTALKLPPRPYDVPRLSPDGRWVALGTNEGTVGNVFIYELSGASSIRQLTFGGRNRFPVWSADGRYVAFQSDREGDLAIFRQRADGTGTAERLTKARMGETHIPDSWSSDGKNLLFDIVKDSVHTLWALSLGDEKIARVGDIQNPLYLDATFSPNARWVAYRSNSAGRSAVSVEPFPPTGAKYLIGNGVHPAWSRDGKALFFRQLTTGEFMITRVTAESGFSFTNPQQLPMSFFERTSNAAARSHDIMPDGRFIGIVSTGEAQNAPPQINVVLNWFEELKRIVPTTH
jgi:serine/threonine-protein kinase